MNSTCPGELPLKLRPAMNSRLNAAVQLVAAAHIESRDVHLPAVHVIVVELDIELKARSDLLSGDEPDDALMLPMDGHVGADLQVET